MLNGGRRYAASPAFWMTVSIVLNTAASSSGVTSLRTGTTTGKPAFNDCRIILATANPRPGGHSSGSSISNVTDPTSHGPTRRGDRGITLGCPHCFEDTPAVLISAHRAATGKEISVDVFEAAYPGWTPDRAPTP